MKESKSVDIKEKIDLIAKEYLFNISSCGKHNHFLEEIDEDSREKYYNNTGFSILSSSSENKYIVSEEMFLEGCTRVFLINPIFKILMDIHGIKNDWKYGNTFGKYTISNREYELESCVEFIAVLEGKNVGVRYTKASYSTEEFFLMSRDTKYLYYAFATS